MTARQSWGQLTSAEDGATQLVASALKGWGNYTDSERGEEGGGGGGATVTQVKITHEKCTKIDFNLF